MSITADLCLTAVYTCKIKHSVYAGLTDANFGYYALNPAQQVTVRANYTPDKQMPFQFVPQIAPPRVSTSSAMSIPENYVLAPHLFFVSTASKRTFFFFNYQFIIFIFVISCYRYLLINMNK